jgi:hypothetical protein
MDRHPDQQQCCMAVAFKGAAWTDPDSVPLMVMQTMLGGWDRNNTSGKHAGASCGSSRVALLRCLKSPDHKQASGALPFVLSGPASRQPAITKDRHRRDFLAESFVALNGRRNLEIGCLFLCKMCYLIPLLCLFPCAPPQAAC